MNVLQRFYRFLNHIFSLFTKNLIGDGNHRLMLEESSNEETIKQIEDAIATNESEKKVNASKRTLLTRLYTIEQQISVFENSYPNEYQMFKQRIEFLRKEYNSNLEALNAQLTFEFDPEISSQKIGQVVELEKDVEKFIETNVKFDIISKNLQRLILKLNILYNVSIFHCGESEKAKVMSQLSHAIDSASHIARDFRSCDYILSNNQLKERIINLFSYIDYQIFKTGIRNSEKTPNELIQKLVMSVEFEQFDYVGPFKAFIQDEITDLAELLPLISDEEIRNSLQKKSEMLLNEIACFKDARYQLFDIEFLDKVLMFESNLLEILKASGVDKEKAKVRVLDKMDISVKENEVLTQPITQTYLALFSLYSTTHDERILLLIKLLKNVSVEVTYKEIYFLLQLFDLIEVIKKNPNDLIRHIGKYIEKYPYDEKTINEKKEKVFSSSKKEYVVAFTMDDYVKETIATLKKSHIDYQVIDDKVLINSFYFNGLSNVLDSLQAITQKTIA